MQNSIASKKFSNNLRIHSPKRGRFQFFDETEFLQEEVQQYFRHGIQCGEGDTIFDVGANIGLFTIYAYQRYSQNINVYSFEPVPNIFEYLSLNISRLNTEKIKIFPFGLSDMSKFVDFA